MTQLNRCVLVDRAQLLAAEDRSLEGSELHRQRQTFNEVCADEAARRPAVEEHRCLGWPVWPVDGGCHCHCAVVWSRDEELVALTLQALCAFSTLPWAVLAHGALFADSTGCLAIGFW